MPTGKVKWFDPDRGFGFITGDDGAQVFLHASALPADTSDPKPGTKVEFGLADGRKGPSALSVQVLEAPPSVAKAHRRPAEDMVAIVEDLIRELDRTSGELRRGRYPERARGTKLAQVLRVLADQFDA